MTRKCFFCGYELGLLESSYVVRWHAKKGAKWLKIGIACETCGETKMTQIESTIKPEPNHV